MQSLLDEGGRPAGPHRVYLRESSIPGLAVSRCFGDYGERGRMEDGCSLRAAIAGCVVGAGGGSTSGGAQRGAAGCWPGGS